MDCALTFRRLAVLQIAVIMVMLFFGLRPKGLTIHNQVEWLEGQKGIRFGDYGMIYTDITALMPAFDRNLEFTIELAIRAATDKVGAFKSLMMVNNGSDKDQLIFGQWKSALVVMNGNDYDNSQRTKKLISMDALTAGNTRWISVISKDGNAKMYIDGQLAASHQNIQLHVPQWEDRVYLVLGNSVYGKNGWDGDVMGLAVYKDALDAKSIALHYLHWDRDHRLFLDNLLEPLLFYQFNQSPRQQVTDASNSKIHLSIPSRVTALKRTFLSPPWYKFNLTLPTFLDIVLNLFGFVPMGLVGGLILNHLWPSRGKTNALGVVAACLAMSLFIESIQVWMPSRASSMLDLILNTSGGAMGAGIVFAGDLGRKPIVKKR